MVDITKPYPTPVNRDLLFEQLHAQYPAITFRDTVLIVHEVLAEDATTIDAILAAHNATQQSNVQTIQTARAGLRDKITLAHDPAIAPHIMALFNVTLDSTLNQTTQPTRFTAVQTVIDAAPVGFKNRFVSDLLHELGIDYATISTDTQRRQTALFARIWSTQLALLLAQPL